MNKQYTKIRRFYATIGFIVTVAVASQIIYKIIMNIF